MEHEWKIKKYEWNIGDLPSDNFWKHRICMNMSCSKCQCKNAHATKQFSCHGLPILTITQGLQRLGRNAYQPKDFVLATVLHIVVICMYIYNIIQYIYIYISYTYHDNRPGSKLSKHAACSFYLTGRKMALFYQRI